MSAVDALTAGIASLPGLCVRGHERDPLHSRAEPANRPADSTCSSVLLRSSWGKAPLERAPVERLAKNGI